MTHTLRKVSPGGHLRRFASWFTGGAGRNCCRRFFVFVFFFSSFQRTKQDFSGAFQMCQPCSVGFKRRVKGSANSTGSIPGRAGSWGITIGELLFLVIIYLSSVSLAHHPPIANS